MEQVGSVLDFSFFPFQPKKVRLFWFIFTVHHLINKFVYIFNLTIWFIKTIFSIFLTKVVLMHVPQRWSSQQCWLVAIKLKPVWLGSFCVEFTGCMFSLTAPRHTRLTDIILKQLYKDGWIDILPSNQRCTGVTHVFAAVTDRLVIISHQCFL